jgi:hypothetical protein
MRDMLSAGNVLQLIVHGSYRLSAPDEPLWLLTPSHQ